MKKKLVALLLCLVMALSLIPTTVWATSGSVPLNLTVSSYSAPFLNGSTGEHTVNKYGITKHISGDAVGNDNSSGSATARFVGSNETGWTLVIDVVIGNYKETWTTKARITNKDMSEATGYVEFGLSFNTSGGTSTYISISGAKELPTPAPVAPTANDLKDLVDIVCRTDKQHNTTSELKANTYATNGVQKEGNKFYWSAEINEANVANYVIDGHQEDTGHNLEIKLVYNNGAWQVFNGNTATIYVKCKTLPPAPSVNWENLTISKLADKTIVKPGDTITYTITVTNNTGKDLGSIIVSDVLDSNLTFVSATPAPAYDSTTGKWGISSLANGESTTLNITATVNSSVTHGETITNTATINAVDVGGDALEVFNDKSSSVTVTVNIPATPAVPDYDDLKTLLAGKVNMVCETNNSHNHTYGLLKNTYTVSKVAQNANGVYTCTVTIINDSGVSEYIAKYNDDTKSKHEAGDKANDLTITLEYDKENSKWVVSATDNTAIIYVKCTSEQEAPEAPTAEDLENYKLVKVDCDTKSSHGEKLYPLLDGTFTTEVTGDGDGNFQCVITITQDGAKKYVEQYGKDLGKTHSLKKLEDATITLKYKDNSWVVDNNDNSASILANCVPTGSHSNTNPSKPSNGKPVTSQKTFDAGIALYAGLSILSLTGGALVIRKRKEF